MTPARPRRQSLRHLTALVAGFVVIAAGPVSAREPDTVPVVAAVASAGPDRARTTMNRRVFDAVWREVQREYYDPQLHGVDWRGARETWRPLALAAPDDGTLYRVMGRMLDLLDDDHAGVAAPAAARRQDALRTRRAVMGLTLYPEDDGRWRIEQVRAGSPAQEAGLATGWHLDTIDGLPWGPEIDVVDGTRVALRLTDDSGEARDVSVTPRIMDPVPAFSADRSRPGVVVLRVEAFEAGLGRWLGSQLADLPVGTDVVLDLRSNPGGLLMEADAALSCFLPARMEWATRTARSGRAAKLKIRPACGDLDAPVEHDVAVLVDRASRSAAELTPAALQEAGRAVVIGETTAGAVLISQETRLPDGGRLTLSRADFVTAGGVRLEKRGVSPDLTVVASAEDRQAGRDPALEAAIGLLKVPVIQSAQVQAVAPL